MQTRQNLIWHAGMRQGLFVVLMKDMHALDMHAYMAARILDKDEGLGADLLRGMQA